MPRLALLSVLLLLATVCTQTLAQFRGGNGMVISMPGSPVQGAMQEISMMIQPPVQRELKLTPVQVDLMKNLVADVQDQLLGLLQGLQDIPPEDRQAAAAGNTKQIQSMTARAKGKMLEVLDEKQKARAKQISLQLRGIAILEDEDVIEALKLTEDQKKELQTIRQDVSRKRREMMQESGAVQANEGGGLRISTGGGSDVVSQMRLLDDELTERSMAVLTAVQKATLEELKGPKFHMNGPPRAFQ